MLASDNRDIIISTLLGRVIDNCYFSKLRCNAIDKINTILCLGRNELQCIHGNYYVVDTGKVPIIEALNIKLINITYVQGLRERCTEDFVSGNYDSVITKSRTVIVEVLIYICNKIK